MTAVLNHGKLTKRDVKRAKSKRRRGKLTRGSESLRGEKKVNLISKVISENTRSLKMNGSFKKKVASYSNRVDSSKSTTLLRKHPNMEHQNFSLCFFYCKEK